MGLKTARSTRLLVVVVLLGVFSAVGVAAAKDDPQPPSISSAPASATNQTSASFTYTDAQTVTKFQCSLDGSAFADCGTSRPSTKSYSGLSAGSHTFRVRAVIGSTTTAATAYSWTVDQTPPPTPAVLGPLVLAPFAFPSTSASFYFSDDEAGVSFLCSLDGSTFAACSSPKSYSGLSQGSHTFRVEAVDAAGNVSAPRSWTWTVDTVDPARPVFTQTPPNPSSTATSTFAWTDSSPDVALYLCSKENGTFLPCSSPLTYAVQTTSSGQHQFAVMAVDWAGRTSPAASYTWKVGAGSPQDFTISGSVTNLQLGVPKVVPVTLTNPNNLPIYVTSLTFAVSTNAGSGGCAASNFSVTQSDASAGTPITVPANGSVTLTTAPRAPRLTLLNLPVNQDVCKNKSFALSHTGSAHS